MADEKLRGDPIIDPIGDLGPYQIILCLLVFVAKYPTGSVTLAMIFLAPKPSFHCEDEKIDKCSPDCEKVVYDKSIFESTIIMDWDLICDKSVLVEFAQAMVMFGILTGSMVVGTLSDRFGRRITFNLICLFNLLTGVLTSFMPEYWSFMIMRFLNAFAVGGIMVTSFVIVMEVVGKKHREFMTIIYQIPFNLGHMSLPLISYFFREWRVYNFVISSVSFFYLIYFFVVPESPRWLFAKGRVDESAAILEKIAKRNGRPTETIKADLEVAYANVVAKSSTKTGTMIDLFRHPNLRKKTLAMAFNWLVVCMVYYGCAQYISQFSGNIFVNVAIGASLGIPGTLVCIPMTMYLGRKKTLLISNAISAVSLLLIAFAPNNLTQVIFATIGLFGSSITFPNVYLYGGELFPTVVRNSGVGFCSMTGRIGSIIAPFISGATNIAMWFPGVVMGIFAFLAFLSVFLMPETRGRPLPETIEEGEELGKKKKPQAEN